MYLSVTYVDSSGLISRTRHYPAESTSHEEVLSALPRFLGRLDACSLAEIVSVKLVYELPLPASSPAQPDSDVYTRLLLIFRDGDEWTTISIPAPAGLPFDTTGPYQGVRITRANLELSGMLPAVERIAKNYLSPTGYSGDFNFVVGGLMRML